MTGAVWASIVLTLATIPAQVIAGQVVSRLLDRCWPSSLIDAG